MKKLLLVLGIVFLIASLVGITAILVEVFRHGITTFASGSLWGGIAFHAVSALLGLFFIEKAVAGRNAAQKEQATVSEGNGRQ